VLTAAHATICATTTTKKLPPELSSTTTMCPDLLPAFPTPKTAHKTQKLKHTRGTFQTLTCLILIFLFVVIMSRDYMIKMKVIKQFLLC